MIEGIGAGRQQAEPEDSVLGVISSGLIPV
jgi:hypothetical protein